MRDHPNAKKKDIDPFLEPPLLIITPDVSDGKSFCGLAILCMYTLAENGNALKTLVGDGLFVQYDTRFLFLYPFFFFNFIE
jgi:hypothetical protein